MLKSSFGVLILLMQLCTVFCSKGPSDSQNANPLLGSWFGQVHYGGESKVMGLRFEPDKEDATVMFFDLPDLKFHDLLSHDGKSLLGVWSFDGHELPFELKPGLIPTQKQKPSAPRRVAEPAWTFKTGGPIWSSPTAAESTVYFGSGDATVYALKADSGEELWHYKTKGPVMGPPTVEGSNLYVLSDDGFLYKLQRHTGKFVWKFDTHGAGVSRDLPGSQTGTYDSMTSGATVVKGTVFVGSADKKLYAVDAETAQEKWHFDTQDIVRSTPSVADGLVFFGSRDHNVYAVDAKTGVLRWKFDTLREVVSSPLVVEGTVYIGSRSADLFALEAATGRVKWRYFYWSSWVESSARMRERTLYVGSSDAQQLFAIDADSGRRVWNFDTGGANWSTPAVTPKQVYIGAVGVRDYMVDHRGGFFAVDRTTGKELWCYPMAAISGSATYGVASSPTVNRGLVFFGGLDGTFYAFRADG